MTIFSRKISALILLILGVILISSTPSWAATTPGPESNSTGLEGVISAPAPKSAPTISVPSAGQTFTSVPIDVAGLCSAQTVKVFSNNVFVGAASCAGGSYRLQIGLFSGRNDLAAIQFDALGQQSPPSGTVTVNFVSAQFAQFGTLVVLSSAYARRGADPGQTLSWPLAISGGQAPYAVSVDWGDGKPAELISQAVIGNFNVDHVYSSAGTYPVIVRATDANGETAFLQLVGVANGQVTAINSSKSTPGKTIVKTEILWWPPLVSIVLIGLAFWLGRRQQLTSIRHRLDEARRS